MKGIALIFLSDNPTPTELVSDPIAREVPLWENE